VSAKTLQCYCNTEKSYLSEIMSLCYTILLKLISLGKSHRPLAILSEK